MFHGTRVAWVAALVMMGCKGDDTDPVIDTNDTDLTDSDTQTDTDLDTDTETDTDPVNPLLYDTTGIVVTSSLGGDASKLALINIDSKAVTDGISVEAGAKVIVDSHESIDYDGDGEGDIVNVVVLAEQSGAGRLRAWDVVDDVVEWNSPILDTTIDTGANAYDIEVCDGTIYVSEYGKSAIALFDFAGKRTGTIDLASFKDGDGSPEPADLVEANFNVYVSMHRYDSKLGVYVTGKLAEISCSKKTVSRSWDAGQKPDIALYPPNPTKLLVRSGIDEAGGSMVLDGGIKLFNSAGDGTFTDGLDEATFGENIIDFVAKRNNAILTSKSYSGKYNVWCLNTSSWESTYIFGGDSRHRDLAVNQDNEVWLSAIPSTEKPTAPSGIQVVDIETCADKTKSNWIKTTLPPGAIAFY